MGNELRRIRRVGSLVFDRQADGGQAVVVAGVDVERDAGLRSDSRMNAAVSQCHARRPIDFQPDAHRHGKRNQARVGGHQFQVEFCSALLSPFDDVMRRVDFPQICGKWIRGLGLQPHFAQRYIGSDRQREFRFHEEIEVGVAAVEIMLLGGRLARVLRSQFQAGDAGSVDGVEEDRAVVVVATFQFQLERPFDHGEVVAKIVRGVFLHQDRGLVAAANRQRDSLRHEAAIACPSANRVGLAARNGDPPVAHVGDFQIRLLWPRLVRH